MLPDGFQTLRLNLRPITEADAPAIFDSYAQDRDVTRYLSWRPHETITETERFVAACLAAETARTYVLVQRRTGDLVGAFDLRTTAVARLECGYVLARRFWGEGLMTEVLSDVVGWALQKPSIWRIGAFVDVQNTASARVLEKAGLEREGLFRRWLVHPNLSDVPRDCFGYAKVRSA